MQDSNQYLMLEFWYACWYLFCSNNTEFWKLDYKYSTIRRQVHKKDIESQPINPQVSYFNLASDFIN